MALAGHPRAMKMAIFTPGPMPLRGTPAHENSPWRLFSPQGPPRPGATSGHEKGGLQRSRRGLFSGELAVACNQARGRRATVAHYGFALADARLNPALSAENGAFCGRPPGPTRQNVE